MALSKMPLVDDRLLSREKLELQQDQAVDDILEAAFGILPQFRRRLRPFVEIGLDCCELGASVTRSLLSAEARHLAGKRCQDGALELRLRTDSEEPEAEAESDADAVHFLLPLVRRRLRCRLEGLMEGLGELADDLGMDRLQAIRTCTTLGALLIPGATAGGAALGSLTAWGSGGLQALLHLCNFDLPTKAVVGASALFYIAGFFLFYNRHPEMQCRTMQKTAAMTCLFALLGDVGVAYMDQFGVPHCIEDVMELVGEPTLTVKLLPSLVCLPLAIANVGYISGKSAGQMKTCMALGVLGAAGSIAAFVSQRFQHQSLLLLGSAGFTLTAVTLLGELQNEAALLSILNRRRSMVSADLLSFAWTCIPMVQGLGALHVLNANLEMKLIEVLTATMLLGTHHIALRSSHAVEKAVDAIEKNTRRNAEAAREPLNEADIRP
eukprot:TRINITY_DN75039_c0_g1_i1.p1 TRINITY_DN75039_c0_g1~~TRINITY_DN75039_c0_g1_i1.p1  ORF type:complete len:438 (+),score=90.48 TRINITY_DN75039_c0_g1_i1:85-1398(+)